jgi:hypothetical protein
MEPIAILSSHAMISYLFVTRVIGKPTASSFLTGWWAAQIAILSWIVPVHPGASLARIVRSETTFPLELARESDYDTRSNEWRSTQGTQPKGKMPCLRSRCYD